jgi:hypothetical protein
MPGLRLQLQARQATSSAAPSSARKTVRWREMIAAFLQLGPDT